MDEELKIFNTHPRKKIFVLRIHKRRDDFFGCVILAVQLFLSFFAAFHTLTDFNLKIYFFFFLTLFWGIYRESHQWYFHHIHTALLLPAICIISELSIFSFLWTFFLSSMGVLKTFNFKAYQPYKYGNRVNDIASLRL